MINYMIIYTITAIIIFCIVLFIENTATPNQVTSNVFKIIVVYLHRIYFVYSLMANFSLFGSSNICLLLFSSSYEDFYNRFYEDKQLSLLIFHQK